MNVKEHLLTCITEECAEIQKATSKALRFGLRNGSPDGETTNSEDIIKEFCDLTAVIEMLQDAGALCTISKESKAFLIQEKKQKVNQYITLATSFGTIGAPAEKPLDLLDGCYSEKSNRYTNW